MLFGFHLLPQQPLIMAPKTSTRVTRSTRSIAECLTTTPCSAFLRGICHVTTSPTTPSTSGSFQQPAGTSTSAGPSQPPLLLSQPSGNEALAADLPGGPPPDGPPDDGPPSDSDWTPPHSASSDIHQKLVIRVK